MSNFLKHLSAGAARTLGLSNGGGDEDEELDAPAPDAAPEPDEGGEGEGGDDGEGQDGDSGSDAGAGTTDQPSSASGQNGRFNMAAMQEAVSLAKAQGAADANKRMKAVFASKEAKKDPAQAAFLLSTSDASAAEIVAHMKDAPRASTAIPDTGLDLGASGNDGSDAGNDDEIDAGWDASRKAVAEEQGFAAAATPPVGASGNVDIAVPKTGY